MKIFTLKDIFLICLFLHVMVAKSLVAQSLQLAQFPRLETVAAQFVKDYGFKEKESVFVHFEKRREGYFVSMSNYDDYPKFAHGELFWSSADRQWKPISVKKVNGGGTARQLLTDSFYYDRLPYYGYAGWYKDVIALLDGKPNLNDTLQFALGQAWFISATSRLSDQFGTADSADIFKLTNSKNALSEQQLEDYLQKMRTSLHHFQILAERYPDFETKVGPAPVKWADNYMDAFLQLQYYQNEKTAMAFLKEAPPLFNDFLLESSRNLLQSCPPDAVLFTWGDNDTYPLLYLQAKEKFRRDVVVANLSLIVLGRYINHLRDSIFDAAPLNFQHAPEFYFSDSSLIVYLNTTYGTASKEIEITDFFRCIKGGNSERQFGYCVCPFNKIYFYTDKSGRIVETSKPANDHYRVEISFPGTYLIRDQLAILDLLYTNTPERPMCFAGTVSGDMLNSFKNHLRVEGLVYRFDPEPKEPGNPDPYGFIDLEKCYQKFTREFQFTSTGKITSDGKPYTLVNRFAMYSTAKGLADAGKNGEAVDMAGLFFRVFPNKRVPFDEYAVFFAKIYADANLSQKALQVAHQIMDNLKKKIIVFDAEDTEQHIGTIREIAEKFDDRSLLKKTNNF